MRNYEFQSSISSDNFKCSILVVDDNEILLNVAMNILISEGHRVMVARSGSEALERYGAHRKELDLIILDMEMPGMHGKEVYKRIKSEDPDTRIIICSGSPVDTVRGWCPGEPSENFLRKPFLQDELIESVTKAVGTLSRSEGYAKECNF